MADAITTGVAKALLVGLLLATYSSKRKPFENITRRPSCRGARPSSRGATDAPPDGFSTDGLFCGVFEIPLLRNAQKRH
jgi:hypothetical protein